MKTLERRLGLWSVVTISLSALLGGIFVLPGIAIGKTGSSAWLAYLAVAFCIISPSLSKAELSTAMPHSGGTYNFVNKAFGPLLGTVMGFGLWASLLLKSAFALLGFGAYLRVLGGGLPLKPIAIGCLILITVLNLGGVKKVSQAQSYILAVSLAALGMLIVGSIPSIQTSQVDAFFSHGPKGFIETISFLFVSYAGVTKVAAIAGEVKDPGKNLPRAIVLSIVMVTPVYCLVTFVLAGNLDHNTLATDIRPIYTLATHLAGPVVGIIAAVIAILTMIAMANSGLLASSRFPFAMSRDSLLPAAFATVSRKSHTPTWCIIFTSLVMAVFIIGVDIESIIKLASAFKILAFMANEISLIILRTSAPQWYKPSYRAPFFPWMQIAASTMCLGLLVAMGLPSVLCVVSVFTIGLVVYFAYGRRHTKNLGMLRKMGRRFDLAAPLPEHAHEVEAIIPQSAAACVALIGQERSVEMLTQMGTALTGRKRVEVIHITDIPDQLALDEMLDEDPQIISMRRRVLGMREMAKVDVRFDAMVSHDMVATVHNLSSRLHCEWLVMSSKPYRFINPLGWLYNHLPNDLALFKDAGIRYIRRILVVTDPSPMDSVVAEAAHNLSQYYRATITFTRFIRTDASHVESQQSIDYLQNIRGLCDSPSDSLLLRGNTEVETISNASKGYDLMVVGARPHNTIRNIFLKSSEDMLVDRCICSALLLKSPRVGPRVAPQPLPVIELDDYVQPELVAIHKQVSNKVELFSNFAQQFSKYQPGIAVDDISTALIEREAAQNTGVCHGVGMPHATLPTLDRTYLMLQRLDNPLEYDAPDNQPVDLVFATLGPPTDRQLHLVLLAKISKLILETSILDQIRAAESEADIVQTLKNGLRPKN
ncbi:MAG: amino acid permease [Deltaproteobacteria bacterium]|nr:amino acid permease [Deltaproteobacteria bacterium]MBT6492481.1 amino acid permease [Deltaproteobacteria bacterium]